MRSDKKQKPFNYTYIKYFLSYFVVFTILIFGFFFIIRNQLSKRYLAQLNTQAEVQLDLVAEQLDDSLHSLTRLDYSLQNNFNLLHSRYDIGAWYNYLTYQELGKYTSSNPFIDSIVFMSKKHNSILSTRIAVEYKDQTFNLIETDQSMLSFCPEDYYDGSFGKLIYFSNDSQSQLIYFPALSRNSNYVYFYVLNTQEVLARLKPLISESTTSIAFVDSTRQIVTGYNASELMPHINSFELEDGIYEIDTSTSICVHTNINNGFSIVSLISNDYLHSQINESLADSYFALSILSIIGFFLVLLAMKITYQPLHNLTQKIVVSPNSKQGYINQLEAAFSQAETREVQLKEKLDKYRLSIKKSLLDSIVSTNDSLDAIFPDLDQLFDTNSEHMICVLQMKSPNKPFPCQAVKNHLQATFTGNDSCIILEQSSAHGMILLCFANGAKDNLRTLTEFLDYYHEKEGYLSIISKQSHSLMDIPALYESVVTAENYWDHYPVVDLDLLPPITTHFSYPHDKLSKLSELLSGHQWTDARLIIDELFSIITPSVKNQDNIPDFFIRCIQTDLLTTIISCMNDSNIKLNSYRELYFETLYYLRAFPASEKFLDFRDNVLKLANLYEQEIIGQIVTPAQLRQTLEASFCNPSFSITLMADQFNVSVSTMSYIFKKELNQNFSDYLWMLRLEKAKELLKNTNMTIDEISIAIGYVNTSSFRRKFKQETGITPSAFRSL